MRYLYLPVMLPVMLLMFSTVSWVSGNSCVDCHRNVQLKDVTRPVHSFAEWEKSVHAKSGVNCDACHGGDSAAKEAAAAHNGVAHSTDPQSRIYFDKIPESCGACHVSELEGFKQSGHYKELHSSGKGPNCVTCHGSMAAQVMSPREMETVCTLCHRRPTQAYAGLLTLQTADKLLKQLKGQLDLFAKQKTDVSAQTATYNQSKESYRQALQVWHTFDMAKVISQSQTINKNLRNALHELKLKSGDTGPEKPKQEEKTKNKNGKK